jgi:hypothetical protein
MNILYVFLIFIALYILAIYFILLLNKNKTQQNKPKSSKSKDSCDIHGCSALDPVSDPIYNMQQIVKQSILLEEHLSNKNKRCRDCITKHFLHIIGLAEEAQMLATNKADKYPLLNENVILYNELFHEWLKCYKDTHGEDDMRVLVICDKLRNNRKQLIVYYFFDEKYELKEKEVKEHQEYDRKL